MVRQKRSRVLVCLLVVALLLSVALPVFAGGSGAGLAQEEPPTLKDMFIGGVNVLALIIILVQIAKDWFGASGNTLRIISLILGIGFAVLWQSTIGFPTDIAGWVICIVRLLYGVLASGIVDFTRDVASRAGSKAIEAVIKRAQVGG
jgi:hypothetical protein